MPSSTAATVSARSCPKTCLFTAAPISCSRVARVTSIATAVEISSAGSCATRPSPIASSEYVRAASPKPIWCCSTPISRPPTRLMARISSPAIASPRTNLLAPSIEP